MPVELVTLTIESGFVREKDSLIEQPFWSITLTEWVPALRFVLKLLLPFDQLYIKGWVPPHTLISAWVELLWHIIESTVRVDVIAWGW